MHAYTFWVSQLDRLPVMVRIAKWGPNVQDSCIVCQSFPETRDHILLHCDRSKQLWSKALQRLGSQRHGFTSWADLIGWLSQNGLSSKTLTRLVAHSVVYHIWKSRNNKLHNGIPTSCDDLFKQVDRNIRDSILARINLKAFRNLLSLWFTYE